MSATWKHQGRTNDAGVSSDGSQKQNDENHQPMADGVNHSRPRIDAYMVDPADLVSIAPAASAVSR